jgi:hypothetical protein
MWQRFSPAAPARYNNTYPKRADKASPSWPNPLPLVPCSPSRRCAGFVSVENQLTTRPTAGLASFSATLAKVLRG